MRSLAVHSRTVSKRGFIVLCSLSLWVGAVDKELHLERELRYRTTTCQGGDGHLYTPSLKPLQMFQGHKSYGPDGIALRWMREGMYGVLPGAQF